MYKKKLVDYFFKTSLIWETLILCIVIFLQHRFWIFRNIYKNFGAVMGSGGDAYYNLSIYLQNLYNFNSGQWYSLEGDHYTFYSNIIGVTAHNFAPSLVFGFLYNIFDNPIFVFNLIFFGNIFLTQVGIYHLIRFYTKNRFVSFLASILVPLSQATVWTFYTGHIHASLYWALPFLILFLELFLKENFEQLDIKKITFFSKYIKPLNIKLILYIVGISMTSLWLFFAEWHVITFSSFWIIIWIVFKLKNLVTHYNKYKIQIISILSIWLLCILLLLPLGLNYLKTSKIYNTTRTIDAVVSTNFNAESFYGSKVVFLAGLNATKGVAQNLTIDTKAIDDATATVSKSGSDFPDKITNFSFILLNILFLPFLFWWIFSNKKKYTLEISLAFIFLITAWVAFGPVLKIADRKIEQILLPHYFIYHILIPLQAIRAIWRVTVISYLSILVFWAVVLSKSWEPVRTYIMEQFPFKKLSKVYLIFLQGFVGLLSILLIFIQQSSFFGNAIPAVSQINPVLEAISKVDTRKEKTFYMWQKGDPDDGLNYQLSLHNLKKGYNELNWVFGGIAGTYPDFLNMSSNFINAGKYLDIPSEVLAAKKVDFIVYAISPSDIENKDFSYNISKYYQKVETIGTKEIWKLVQAPEYIDSYTDLKYFLTLSKYQNSSDKIQVIVNVENPTDKVFALQDKVKAEEYVFDFYQKGKKVMTQKLEIGGIAALTPKLGLSYSEELETPKEIGNMEIKMFKDGVFLTESKVEVLSKYDYEKRLDKELLAKFETKSDIIKGNKISLGISTYPIKMNFEIKSGALNNHPQKLPISINTSVLVNYKNDEGLDYGGFPAWLFQPTCHLYGNYFPGDNLDFWCTQYLPFDETFHYATVKFGQER